VSANPVFWPGGRTTSIFKGETLVSVLLFLLEPGFHVEGPSRPGEISAYPLCSSTAVNTRAIQPGPIRAWYQRDLLLLIHWKKSVLEAVQHVECDRGSLEERGTPLPPPACKKLFQIISFMRCLCPADSAAKTKTIYHDIVRSNNQL